MTDEETEFQKDDVVTNPDRRGHTETCGEAWGERQIGGAGSGVKEELEAGALAL